MIGVKATINGQQRDVPPGITVKDLLTQIEAPERGVAVAKNDRVISRAAFSAEPVEEGDRIEIIQAVAGG